VRDRLSRSALAAAVNSVGLPIAVQIATRPFRDELCLHVMSEVERVSDFGTKGIPGIALHTDGN
jgi:Asp-tRNA(Asn)/Glu-tRNA(Gln) amidotransferase A subunit family amidase